MSVGKRFCVWGSNGYIKMLVYEPKFLPATPDRPAGYYECLRIEEPRAKAKDND